MTLTTIHADEIRYFLTEKNVLTSNPVSRIAIADNVTDNGDGTWTATKKVVAPFAVFEFAGHADNYAEFIRKRLLRQFPSLNLFVIQCSYVSIESLWVVRFNLVETPSIHDTDDWSLFTELAAISGADAATGNFKGAVKIDADRESAEIVRHHYFLAILRFCRSARATLRQRQDGGLFITFTAGDRLVQQAA
jgi:hypothetical protein